MSSVREWLFEGLRPDPILSVDEWADLHFRLTTKNSSEPGNFRTERTPYLKEILQSLSAHDPIDRVVFISGAQVGKSTAGLAWLGYLIDCSPSPILAVQPTVELAKRFSKQRVQSLIEESPRLKRLVKPARERDSGNTLLSKEFPGGILMITGANSAAGLRSMPIRALFIDELDAFPLDIEGEGSPVELAEARTRTFSRRKILLTSTPTTAGTSRIWAEWEESDQRQYHVPCPHCGHQQIISWDQIRYDETDRSVPVVLICLACGVGIEEGHKGTMLANGEWIAANPGAAHRGFHLSSLYSPLGWFSWREAVDLWIKAQNNAERMKTFVNTVLGQCYEEYTDLLDWETLYRRIESYPVGIVPPGVTILTAGVDVQSDRLEISVIGWGRELESWVISHDIIYGDTSQDDTWENLTQYWQRPWPCADGQTKYISKLALDTGFNTQFGYHWVRSQARTELLAIKGMDNLHQLISTPSNVEINFRGKIIKNGIKLWGVGSSHVKSWLYGKLRLEAPLIAGDAYPEGFVHFPALGEEYFKQVCAEVLSLKIHPRTQMRSYEWVRIRDRNEALDCFVYARAAAAVMGVDRWTDKRWESGVIKNPPMTSKQGEESVVSKGNLDASTGKDMPSLAPNITRKKSKFWN